MTIEFVAFAPLLLAALVFSYEFGRAFWAFDVVTRDVRAGVRYAARLSTPPPPDCPAFARNIAQTGSPVDATDESKHFPWKGVSATFTCLPGSITNSFTMEATVPITLSLLDFFNRFLNLDEATSIKLGYPLTVSYQARYIGN